MYEVKLKKVRILLNKIVKYRIAYLNKDKFNCEDIVQDCMIRFINVNPQPTFENEKNLFGYLDILVKNELLLYTKKKAAKLPAYPADEDLPEILIEDYNSTNQNDEKISNILEYIKNKDEKLHFILINRMENLTYEHIASKYFDIYSKKITRQGIENYFSKNIKKFYDFFEKNEIFVK